MSSFSATTIDLSASGAASHKLPAPHEVRTQLARILASPDFPASDRNRRFFQLVVENTLAGESTPGADVAIRILGRPDSFCPKKDPIVRVEAAKLRRDLETYYLKGGKHDPVLISLPKGRYLARFAYNPTALEDSDPARPQILILRAALAGLAGEAEEARVAWEAVRQEFPDFSLNPGAHDALQALCGKDQRVRRHLLEGLRRAAMPSDHITAARETDPLAV